MPRLPRSFDLPPGLRRFSPKWVGLAIVGLLVVVNLVVPRSAPASMTPVAPAALAGWFDDTIRDAGIPGAAIVVVRDGQVVLEHGVGVADDMGRPVTAQTPFVIGSLAKSLTALAVAQLVERGRLDFDAPVQRYLPVFAVSDPDASRRITVRQLLNQTSGLPTTAGTTPLSQPASSLEVQVRALASVRLSSAPGATFQYSNANYLVLGRLVEVVSGQTYESYMRANVFDPLEMTHASSVLATARADGLGQAHRLWFGLPDLHDPLFREDLAPAGFVAASADDLAHVLIAEMDGGRYGTSSIASPGTVAELWRGVAPAGASGSYAMGWFDGTLDGERIVSHTGSTTDMASFQAVVPSRGLGVIVLLNGQSVLYEALHKPDSIGLAAVAMLSGHEPLGTLSLFYPAFDLFAGVIVALLVRNVVRLARRPVVPARRPWPATWRGRAMLLGRLYLDVVVPVAVATGAPIALGAPWWVLVRIDLGLVLAIVAALRLADGAVRVARTVRAARLARGSGASEPGSALAGGVTVRGGR